MEDITMEWLQELINNATKDGAFDSAAFMTAYKAEFPKHAVPKEEFNGKVNELKTATDTIKNLEKANKDNEELQKTIQKYKADNEELQKTATKTAQEYYTKDALKEMGVLDPDYMIYKLGEKLTYDKENKPVGLKELVDVYRPTSPHLFKQEQEQKYNPTVGKGGAYNNPFAKETFNLTEQGRLYKTNPDQAKAYASEAGVTLNF